MLEFATDSITALAGSPGSAPTTVTNFTWAAAGSWAQFVALATVIGAIVRYVGPVELLKTIFGRNKELRQEAREEELSLATRMDALELRASTAERRLGFVASACTTLLSALELVDPNNPALRQARTQLAMASGKDVAADPFADMLDKLAGIPPVDRNPSA